MHKLFETERLNAFLMDDTGAKQLLAYEKENKEAFAQFSIAHKDSHYTLANFLNICEKQALLYEQKRKLPLVFVKKNSWPIIATVSLNEIVYGAFRSSFIGYSVGKIHQRQGYATEAVKATIDYAFQTMLLHRIEANIMPENIPSLSFITSLGFVNEGLSKNYLFIDGKWEDHYNMVLINEQLDMKKVR